MTAKRFQWVYIKDNLLELRDNGVVKVFNNERLEELLNDLHEENNELKKENEQLKHSIKCLEADKMELQQYIKRTQGDDVND